MGAELKCSARVAGVRVRGTVKLETGVLQFRGGDVKLNARFADLKSVTAKGEALVISGATTSATFEIGAAAAKAWAEKILNPPSRVSKIGVKPGAVASIVKVEDRAFVDELQSSGVKVVTTRVAKPSDAIFFGAANATELSRLTSLVKSLRQNGALWVIRPKGRPEISERAVMDAGRAAGLVDVKVVKFSETHTAEKFVIPVAKRR